MYPFLRLRGLKSLRNSSCLINRRCEWTITLRLGVHYVRWYMILSKRASILIFAHDKQVSSYITEIQELSTKLWTLMLLVPIWYVLEFSLIRFFTFGISLCGTRNRKSLRGWITCVFVIHPCLPQYPSNLLKEVEANIMYEEQYYASCIPDLTTVPPTLFSIVPPQTVKHICFTVCGATLPFSRNYM